MPVAAFASVGGTDYSGKYLTIVAAGLPLLQAVTRLDGSHVRPHSKIQWIDLVSPGGTSKTLVHGFFILCIFYIVVYLLLYIY